MNTFYIECYHIDQSSIIKYILNRPHKNRETDCIVVLVSCHFSFWHCELFILIPLETIIETGIYVLRYFIVSASANIYVYVVTNMNRDRLTKKNRINYKFLHVQLQHTKCRCIESWSHTTWWIYFAFHLVNAWLKYGDTYSYLFYWNCWHKFNCIPIGFPSMKVTNLSEISRAAYSF